MSMITCRECGKEFSDQAESCPNCGAPTRISRPFGVPYEGAPEQLPTKEGKFSVCALISFIIGILYLIYSFFYWGSVGDASVDVFEQIGTGIATAVVMPHLISTAVAVLLNALGCFMKRSGLVLAGAILYCVALLLMPIYFMFVVIEIVLSFVAYARMSR